MLYLLSEAEEYIYDDREQKIYQIEYATYAEKCECYTTECYKESNHIKKFLKVYQFVFK